MLQQTTVAAVIPFYERFLRRFPTVESLAQASLEEVLPLWAGLGYYSRARNLHKMAHAVMETHGGHFPRDPEAVLKLPGVGRYTAGAVTSIAFDAPSPIVDANVARVFSRIFLLDGDLKSSANQKRLWQEAETTVQKGEHAPSQLNPALMELGALVCVPRVPRCSECPVSAFCGAFAAGRQNELPHATAKRDTVELRDACGFWQREGQIFLRQRSHDAKIWWRGMWELPRVTARDGETTQDALRRLLNEEFDIEPAIGANLKTMGHGVTHHHITLECFAFEADGEPSGGQWFEWEEIEHLALPSVMRRLLAWLKRHPGAPAQQLSLL
jgi:A/G-specific adenine glycosylase